ncbi:hypothetical protein SAMN02745181_1746 [Rubritalea squalenifaciens DSM 18772]|uniref:Uncharacterized protein n=1 Tax=Rubritalea squalenifaciens DSM 18772 TaxID=1123071 RepID=A0A1M6IBB2_9BACT|nr:hypothetical protein [Rubritalea squalenifaciens]SHJ31749.1 hypothetical protein SAMN02745181_1746 [Rubritalea squalenifaciens DSM 18772]
MIAVEIEEAVSLLAEQPFEADAFPYAFLEAFVACFLLPISVFIFGGLISIFCSHAVTGMKTKDLHVASE